MILEVRQKQNTSYMRDVNFLAFISSFMAKPFVFLVSFHERLLSIAV